MFVVVCIVFIAQVAAAVEDVSYLDFGCVLVVHNFHLVLESVAACGDDTSDQQMPGMCHTHFIFHCAE